MLRIDAGKSACGLNRLDEKLSSCFIRMYKKKKKNGGESFKWISLAHWNRVIDGLNFSSNHGNGQNDCERSFGKLMLFKSKHRALVSDVLKSKIASFIN